MTYQRKEQIGDCTLYLGDCLDILPTLDLVDAVVTDPPYSDNTHKMAKTNKGSGHGKKLITFASLSDDDFRSIVRSCISVTRGWVVMTCDYRHAALMYDDPAFVRLGAWVKPNPMPQISADRPGQGFETVLCLHAGKVKKKWFRGGGSGVWTVPVVTGALVPTQKPETLIGSFLSDFTEAGETILDPFMGSGTTGAVCVKSGRKFIGIESDPERFEIALSRMKSASVQTDFFIPRPVKPTQEAMDLD